MDCVRQAGWSIVNIDAVIVAQAPRIAPYAAAMAANIAADLDVAVTAINVKGKTTENLGFEGRREGIAAQAVALVRRS
jgi:2-C-methyl-D-erythritol 2,4-cyclodiphosphate synthase